MLEIGTKAPDFTLLDENGTLHTLEEYRGKKVILYFYPKDNTPGCTKQACGFSEMYPMFLEKGAVVLGVSKDSVASHKNITWYLHFYQIRSFLSFRLMTCGKKRRTMEKCPWVWYEPLI